MIEIARAISTDCKMLVMDEPTAALERGGDQADVQGDPETRWPRGSPIVYISHKLSEVFEIGDCVTVLRDGKIVGNRSRGGDPRRDRLRFRVRGLPGTDQDDAGQGRPGGVRSQQEHQGGDAPRGPEHQYRRSSRDVSFDLRKGEILGFYGLVGAGKTEVAQVLYGIDPYQGEILLEGQARPDQSASRRP
ncbi:MAG: ATP-binding cassette domain-containing protein [Candidatus Moduliflexus flocculans]|nr:ATP-binding cassette domain-containing protein [Candidatus Moduliflexus flocculans]